MSMLRFAEEIMLLVLDDKGGKFADVPILRLSYALAGGVLMDLALEGRIDTDPEQFVVIDPSPLGDDLLDPVLARIVRSTKTRDTHYWIEETLKHVSAIRERSLARLIEHGILRQEDERFLWVFQTRRYPVIDDRTIRDVKMRIKGVLFSDEIPDVRDIVIISLSDACGILESLLSSQEMKGVAGRIEQVCKMELICREIVKAASRRIRDIESSTASKH